MLYSTMPVVIINGIITPCTCQLFQIHGEYIYEPKNFVASWTKWATMSDGATYCLKFDYTIATSKGQNNKKTKQKAYKPQMFVYFKYRKLLCTIYAF